MESGIRFSINIFLFCSQQMFVCVCTLCKHWHVYTGRSHFILDPFGFQGILNVDFIWSAIWIELYPDRSLVFLHLISDALVRMKIEIVFFMQLAIFPFLGRYGISIPIPYFIWMCFSETFSTETEQNLKWGLSALLLWVTWNRGKLI